MPLTETRRADRGKSVAGRPALRSVTAKGAIPRKTRAAGLSRERIITATVRYLRENPHEKLTMARAAAAAGATTMAVYRHFRDFADLADAIVENVFEGLSDDIPQDADWRTQVRAWMEAIHQRFLDTPQCVELLTTTNGLSVAWVRAEEGLRRSLFAGGLRDPKLMEANFWIGMTVVGFSRHMLSAPMSAHVDGAVAAIHRLDPEGVSELSTLVPAISGIYARAREIMFERTLASVELLMDDAGAALIYPAA